MNLCIPGDLLKENTEKIAFGMKESCSTHCAIPTWASVSKTWRKMATESRELFSGGFQKSYSRVNACQRSWGISRATCFYDAPATSVKYWSIQPYRCRPWISAVFQHSLRLHTDVALFSRVVCSQRKFSSFNMDTSTCTQTDVVSQLLMQMFAC